MSWELDALKPDVLHGIVTEAVGDSIDMVQFSDMLVVESDDKVKLKELIREV